MRKDIEEKIEWFNSRIGQRVYRDAIGCNCKACQFVKENGLIVTDEMHADYLAHNAIELGIEYRDKP